MQYKRIMLKLSGEALMGEKEFGIDSKTIKKICAEISEVQEMGVEIAVVVGAGNIWRGARNNDPDIDRASSDYIGMMGTIMNGVALQATLEKKFGITSRVCTALDFPAVAEPYLRRRAVRHLEKGRVVICVAGTGNPYFTTDSAASLRSIELGCEILLKGTNVDGVYDDDPNKNPKAKKYKVVSFDEVLEKNLKVMDSTAIAQCRDNKMPVKVFELMKKGNLKKMVCGKEIGTSVIL